MKNFSLCWILSLLSIFFGSVYGNEKDPLLKSKFVKCEKIYVAPHQVAITSEGIFVQFKEEWMMTDAIHRDNGGLFISSIADEWSWYWTCPKCGYEKNTAFDRSCRSCGFTPTY